MFLKRPLMSFTKSTQWWLLFLLSLENQFLIASTCIVFFSNTPIFSQRTRSITSLWSSPFKHESCSLSSHSVSDKAIWTICFTLASAVRHLWDYQCSCDLTFLGVVLVKSLKSKPVSLFQQTARSPVSKCIFLLSLLKVTVVTGVWMLTGWRRFFLARWIKTCNSSYDLNNFTMYHDFFWHGDVHWSCLFFHPLYVEHSSWRGTPLQLFNKPFINRFWKSLCVVYLWTSSENSLTTPESQM